MLKKLFFIGYGLLVFSCSQEETTMSINLGEFNISVAISIPRIAIATNGDFSQLCSGSDEAKSPVPVGKLSSSLNQLLRI